MNAVEIEEAISQLADQPFDPENFPYSFLEAFGNKETTIKRLRTGASNKSDLGGVLQTNNVHIATCITGHVTNTLTALKASPATAKAKVKFILATDGVDFEAENLWRVVRPLLALTRIFPTISGSSCRLPASRLTGTGVKFRADDLFSTPLDQPQIDFENEGGETYICGNPPYLGSTWQSTAHKEDLQEIFAGRTNTWKSLDYVAGWFMKAADYGTRTTTVAAFVATNSICQGQQVSFLWPLIFHTGHEIAFANPLDDVGECRPIAFIRNR